MVVIPLRNLGTVGDAGLTNESTNDDARHWRILAEQARMSADRVSDPVSKRVLYGIAESYESLARRAEQSEKSEWGVDCPARGTIRALDIRTIRSPSARVGRQPRAGAQVHVVPGLGADAQDRRAACVGASRDRKGRDTSVRAVAHFIEGQLENADNFAGRISQTKAVWFLPRVTLDHIERLTHGASDHLSLAGQDRCSLFDGSTAPEPLNPEHLPSPAWCASQSQPA